MAVPESNRSRAALVDLPLAESIAMAVSIKGGSAGSCRWWCYLSALTVEQAMVMLLTAMSASIIFRVLIQYNEDI